MPKPMNLPPAAVEKIFYLEAQLGEEITIGDVGKGTMSITPIEGRGANKRGSDAVWG